MAHHLLLIVALLVGIAMAAIPLPYPTVVFKVNPNMSRKTEFFPTCHPYVHNTSLAYWCYYDLQENLCLAGVTSPSEPLTRFPQLTLREPEAYFDFTPQPLSNSSALFASNQAASSTWAAASPEYLMGPDPRFNSTADPAADITSHKAFVPYGVHHGFDMLTMGDITDVNNPIFPANSTWRHVPNDDGLSLIRDVVPYEGFVFFMHNNSFYKMNATTMNTEDGGFIVKDPCSIGLRARNGLHMRMVTYGEDINGPLNAFIIFGNTTNETRVEFVMCRVSHITGAQKWQKIITDDFDVQDITGGAGALILLTGYAVSSMPIKYVTLVSSVLTGKTYGTVQRIDADEESFPVFIPSGVVKINGSFPCGPAFVMQVKGTATSYCIAPFVAYNQPIAPAYMGDDKVQCAYRPAYDPITKYIVCSDPGDFVIALQASDMKAVWMDNLNVYMTKPQIVIENGESYIFVSDLDSTLWGFAVALPPPSSTPVPPFTHPPTTTEAPGPNPTPAPSENPTDAPTHAPTPGPTSNTGGGGTAGEITGGEAAGIAIGVILAVGLLGGVALVYFRKSKRRAAYRNQNTAINEYGALS